MPVEDIPGLTSITFIESTAGNREYTFDRNAVELMERQPDPLGTIPIRSIPGLETITFIESTGENRFFTFATVGPELLNRIPDLTTDEDFHGVVASERYDVYFSNADGSINPDGAYVTIEAIFSGDSCSGGGSGGGLNISEVQLDLPNPQFGTVVTSAVYLGSNAIPGSASLAADGDPNTDCIMGNTVGAGDQRMRVTIGFGLAAADFETIAEEFYDVYYSDADGVLDPNGEYITIEAVFLPPGPGGGLNISEVRLNRGLQSEYANVVASAVYLGGIPGSAAFAADGDLATDSAMGSTSGGGRLRITLGFASSSGGATTPTRFRADVDEATAATNGFPVPGTIHLFNSGAPKLVDWQLDSGGWFDIQPESGTAMANSGETTIDVEFSCNCARTLGAAPVAFRTINADGDNAIAVGSWKCDIIVGVPLLSWPSALIVILSVFGVGTLGIRRRVGRAFPVLG